MLGYTQYWEPYPKKDCILRGGNWQHPSSSTKEAFERTISPVAIKDFEIDGEILSFNFVRAFEPSVSFNNFSGIKEIIRINAGGLQSIYCRNQDLLHFNPSGVFSSLCLIILSNNKIKRFRPTSPMERVQVLDLSSNRLTTEAYNEMIPFANSINPIELFPNSWTPNFNFSNNDESISGTQLETIFLSKNKIVIP